MPQVSAADRETLEQLVCLGPHQLPLESIDLHTLRTGGKHPVDVNEAEVRCRSHGDVAGLPLHYVQQCDATRQHWTCSPASQEFALTLNARVVLVSSAELEPVDALAMVKSVGRAAVIAPAHVDTGTAAGGASAATGTAAGASAAAAATTADAPEHCRIASRGGADPELYKFSCDVWELLVVRHCDGAACSYRAIERGAPLFQ